MVSSILSLGTTLDPSLLQWKLPKRSVGGVVAPAIPGNCKAEEQGVEQFSCAVGTICDGHRR